VCTTEGDDADVEGVAAPNAALHGF